MKPVMTVMDEHVVLMDRAVASGALSVREARREVHEVVSAVAPTELADDAELVAAELLTNAEEQGSRSTGVVLRRIDGRVALTVSDDGRHGDDLPELHTWTEIADAAGRRGRGLAIVAALSESIDVDRSPGGTSITCWWTLPTT